MALGLVSVLRWRILSSTMLSIKSLRQSSRASTSMILAGEAIKDLKHHVYKDRGRNFDAQSVFGEGTDHARSTLAVTDKHQRRTHEETGTSFHVRVRSMRDLALPREKVSSGDR